MTNTETEISYLAIGDSYTIGEDVPLESSFPYQLTEELKARGLKLTKPDIIAKTGWTTSELQDGIRSAELNRKYTMVTLLIGVNNQYRGEPKEKYRNEFKELLQTAITFANGNETHVFVVSIPDWGLTPFGMESGRDIRFVSSDIDAFNAINKEESLAEGVSYTDITVASRLVVSDKELIASDGLHPSPKMYLDWALKLAPVVMEKFK
ncbi:lysophospholipase [Pedobacter steynii]|uniref:Lysophospholipase n=2 Tax=Pedobacter steynii TaxID=430522 RepID=A0A1D7QG42_9SPHI|nr:lysophospholipase [Pedobacter steynii]